jgi:Domain of unknown function (DUF222)/HNH endonuclease
MGTTEVAVKTPPRDVPPLTTAELTALLDRLPSLELGVPDAERIDQLGLLESIKAAAAGAQARVSVAFAESQRAQREAAGVPRRERSRGLGAQVALARRESPHRGSRHLGLAQALIGEMPYTFAHLSAGRVSEWRASIACRETACLSAEDRATVDRLLARELPTLGDREVEARARALACQLDNGAMARRAAKAQSERCVTLRPAPDTMAYLSALLPVAQGVAALAALDRAAAAAVAEGDERTRAQVMADTLVERITGQASASAVPLEVELVMPVGSLFDDGDEPARFAASGTGSAGSGTGAVVPAAFARSLILECKDAGAKAWLRRVFTTPDGIDLVARDLRRRTFGGTLRDLLVARDQICRTPWCDAPIRHVDHVRPARDDGPTSDTNGQGLCEACNYAKEAPGWSAATVHDGPSPGVTPGSSPTPPHTVRTTTPTGHTYDSTAPPVLPSRSRQPVRARPDIRSLEQWFTVLLEVA